MKPSALSTTPEPVLCWVPSKVDKADVPPATGSYAATRIRTTAAATLRTTACSDRLRLFRWVEEAVCATAGRVACPQSTMSAAQTKRFMAPSTGGIGEMERV